ncbi:MAG: DUF1996 domain-containing protein [Acidimicrobiia bacterium]
MKKLKTISNMKQLTALVALCALSVLFLSSTSPAYASESIRKSSSTCYIENSAYRISSKIPIANSSSQTIWIKVKVNHLARIKVEIDQSTCVSSRIYSTNGQWKFIQITRPTAYVQEGNHEIVIGASHSDLNWSTLWIFPSSSICTPNIDTINIVCNSATGAATKLYASGVSSLVYPKVTTSTTTTTTTTAAPTTTTTPTTIPPTTTTTPANTNCFANSVGVVSHPIDLSSSGTQQIWLNISTSSNSNISLLFDSKTCLNETVLSTNSSFKWINLSSLTTSLTSGYHDVSIGSSLNGTKLSTVLIFNSNIKCVPTNDGTNCPIPPVTTTTTTTTLPPTPTTKPTTTTPPTQTTASNDNAALEKFRNFNSQYERNSSTPSSLLPLNLLTRKSNPSPSIFLSSPGGGKFRTSCDFSHLAYDDPIIKPNLPGKSHLHMFYGNTKTNAFSTANSIVNSGGSTCDGFEANRTAYWVPAMLDASGNARIPNGMVVYYKSEGIAKPANGFEDIPQGLKIIAGNANATSPQTLQYNNGFGCGNMFINPTSSLIPSCDSSTGFMLKVHFPRCWDGSFDFDPTSPQKHVTYEVNGQCPSTHQKIFTGITVLFDWDLAPGETTAGWHLASDEVPGGTTKPGGTTLHGDWFGGWNNEIMHSWNQNCSNALWDCSLRYLGNNGHLTGVPDGGVNELIPTLNKQDTLGPIACVLPKRTNT